MIVPRLESGIPTNILIVKLAAIGDVIMALPLARELKKLYPECHITWLCGQVVAPLLQKIADIDALIVIDDSRLLRGSKPEQVREVVHLWQILRNQRYDLILDGHVDKRYRFLTRPLKAERRSWQREAGARLWPVPGRHHSDEYVRLAYSADDLNNVTAEHIEIDVPCALPLPDGPVVAMAPGGAKNALADDFLRRWPIDSYVQLAHELVTKGYSVLLTGGPSDTWVRASFEAAQLGPSVVDYIGQTDLLSLVGLYRKVGLVVTHDSGPLHLAGLAGADIVALFGPTIPQEKVPRTSLQITLWGGETLACRPCYDGKTYAPCPFPACLSMISVRDVVCAIEELSIKRRRA